ncbi:MAG: heme ABC transporter ATP-binding protein [Leptospira sp.]|nr:heme ABC transporter ATP-binding protein [Leptospira sp.]
MIQANGLEYSYGSRKILDGVDINLREGELVTLLGRNGEGKSTLFRILTGEMEPHQGVVRLNDRNLREMNWKDLARNRSVLPQESILNFPLRVSEIVDLGRSPHKRDKLLDLHYTEKSMKLTDVYHLKDRFYSQLSGGEKKRVQIARVLCQLEKSKADLEKNENQSNGKVNHPQKGFLFLDEPVNSLDVLLQHKIMEILRHLTDVGYAVFVILHDWNLAGLYSDRILVLNRGNISFDGTPKETIHTEMLREIFGIESNVFHHSEEKIGGYSTKTF